MACKTLYHGTTSDIAKKIHKSGTVKGWWSTSRSLACQYAWGALRKSEIKSKKQRPVIIEACIDPLIMVQHARVAWYPKDHPIPKEAIKGIWEFKPFKGLTSPCLDRNWTKHDF